jgi:hypothetical protein
MICAFLMMDLFAQFIGLCNVCFVWLLIQIAKMLCDFKDLMVKAIELCSEL